MTSFDSARRDSGWRTRCRASPLPHGRPALVASEDEDGWEPARERSARVGYTYACRCTSHRAGFRGVAERQYWSLWRRRRSEAE